MKREYDFSNAKRGAVVPVPPGKTRITIRIDDEVLDWFRELVNAVSRVIREELRRKKAS